MSYACHCYFVVMKILYEHHGLLSENQRTMRDAIHNPFLPQELGIHQARYNGYNCSQQINQLIKEKKNNIIDRYIEGLKRNISKKKEFQLNIELQETEKNITRKLKDKEKLLLKIIKTI